MAYRRGGEGDPMVLVHGIGGSWRNWLPILPALEARHDVLTVGLLGHHPNHPFASGVRPTVAALIDGVEREMDRGGFGTAHLVGNSLGGWIVLELAKRGRAVTVCALSPGGTYRDGELVADLTAMRLAVEHRLVARALRPRAERLVRRAGVRRLLFSGTFTHPERIDAAEAWAMLDSFGGASVFIALLRAMKRDGPLRDLDRVTVPTLIGWGTRDYVLPMRWFLPTLREQMPAAQIRELPGLGHVPMVDDPVLVADLVLDFTAHQSV